MKKEKDPVQIDVAVPTVTAQWKAKADVTIATMEESQQAVSSWEEDAAMWRGIQEAGAIGKETLLRSGSEEAAFSATEQHIIGGTGRSDSSVYWTLFARAWCDTAFSTVNVSESLAANLMCTQVNAEIADGLELPWPCFRVNAGTLGSVLVAQAPDAFFALYTIPYKGRPAFCPITKTKTLGNFLRAIASSEQTNDDDLSEDEVSSVGRGQLLLNRLLIGVCLELASRSAPRRPPAFPAYHRKGRSLEPNVWKFELRRAVKIDCRPAVREYIQRGAKAPTVQSLVRGHYKMQPHGPNRSLRKWIHVEPYWRGPEDAPIATRALKLV